MSKLNQRGEQNKHIKNGESRQGHADGQVGQTLTGKKAFSIPQTASGSGSWKVGKELEKGRTGQVNG